MGKPCGQPSPSTKSELGLFALLIYRAIERVTLVICCVGVSEEPWQALQGCPAWSPVGCACAEPVPGRFGKQLCLPARLQPVVSGS